MKLSQRLALGACIVLAGLATAYVALLRAHSAVPRLHGTLAPYSVVRPPQIVGTVDPASLRQGPIVAVADDGSAVFLLQNHCWLRVDSSGAAGPFGTQVRGAAGAIISGADITVRDSFVYVLDRTARAVVVFTRNGEWRLSISLLPTTSRLAFTPEHVTVDQEGRLIVSGFRQNAMHGSSRLLLRQGAGAFDSLFAVPAGLFDILLPVVATSRQIFAVESAQYRLTQLAQDGSVIRTISRPDPPRIPTPDSVRRTLDRYRARFPANARAAFAINAYLPAVVAAAAVTGGGFVVAVVTSMDSVLIEELDSNAHAIRTLNREPLPMPVAVTGNSIISIREEANATVVERRRIR